MDKKLLYRSIPKVDEILEKPEIIELIETYGREVVMDVIRRELDEVRMAIGVLPEEKLPDEKTSDEKVPAADRSSVQRETQIQKMQGQIQELILNITAKIVLDTEDMFRPDMKPVLNGTGTILHTNLGRAPIGKKHMDYIASLATGYSNLEYHLETGRRGERYAHFERLLCKITGAEAAMAVNNNAAAVMLILSSLAKGGEVVVSRGELVEIGGKFRIPDVMEQSGAKLVEVGTTNKTHLDDYQDAITENTKALLKVHTSNYRIIGFTESVSIQDLVPIAKEYEIPIIEDLGSGVLIDLGRYGITYEPTVQDSIRGGADVVCFSGDKLLGGPQAGIIVGKKKYIDIMKKNQLTRALRIDKFTASALEQILLEYLSEEKAVQNIPALRMITKTMEEVTADAGLLCEKMRREFFPAKICVVPVESQIGGGSLPLERIPGMGVEIDPDEITTSELERRFRKLPVPMIARMQEDKILIDVRTMEREQFDQFVEELKKCRTFEAGTAADGKKERG